MIQDAHRRDLKDGRPPRQDGISVGTMQVAKGLEFKAVAVIGCGEHQLPDQETLDRAADQTEYQELLEQESNLLYVALSRPREKLLVTGIGALSKLFPEELVAA